MVVRKVLTVKRLRKQLCVKLNGSWPQLVERNQHERELVNGLIPFCVLQNASCLFLWEPWDPHSMTIYPDSYQFKWNSIIPLDEGLEDRVETALKAAPTRTNPEDVTGPLFRSGLPLLIYGTVWLRNRACFNGSLHESTLSHFLWSSKWIYTKLNYHKSMVIMSITMRCLYLCLQKGKGSVSSASSSHDFIFTFGERFVVLHDLHITKTSWKLNSFAIATTFISLMRLMSQTSDSRWCYYFKDHAVLQISRFLWDNKK